MPFLVIIGFGLLGAALYGMGAATRATSPASGGAAAGSAWARARARGAPPAPTPTPTRTPEAEAARICTLAAETISLDGADLAAWADCPGRAVRDLRVLAARLERAATDETSDSARRGRLIDAHVSLMDWIARREREGAA